MDKSAPLTWNDTVAEPRLAALGWWGEGAQPVMKMTWPEGREGTAELSLRCAGNG